MKLKIQVTQTNEVEIMLPLFFKEERCENYLAILDEKTAIDLYISSSGDYVNITNTTPDKRASEIDRALNSWRQITETEFFSAWDDAYCSISLRPKLSTGNEFVDSLNKVMQ